MAVRLGRRDRTLLLVAIRTDLRSSELTGLRRGDVVLAGAGAQVRCIGKSRKTRSTPQRPDVVPVLASWVNERGSDQAAFVFPMRHDPGRGTAALRASVPETSPDGGSGARATTRM